MDNAFSPYEQVKLDYMQSKCRTSGIGIAGLATGIGVGVAAIGVGMYAVSKAGEARRTAAAENAGTAALLKQATEFMTSYMKEERQERKAETVTLSQTINDTISGQQTSTLTAQQASELSSIQNLQNTLLTDAVTGRSGMNPTPVTIYSAPAPCGCPCNG